MSDWDHDELEEETEMPPEGTEGDDDEVADEPEAEGDIPEGFTEVEEESTF